MSATQLKQKYNHGCMIQCFQKKNIYTKIMQSIPATFGAMKEDFFTQNHLNSLEIALSQLSGNDLGSQSMSVLISTYLPSLNDICYYNCHFNLNQLKLCKIFANEYCRMIKVTLLGPDGVGKSSLVVRYITGKFIRDIGRNAEDSYRKLIEIDNNRIIFDIVERNNWGMFGASQIYILTFAIDSKTSLNDAIKNKAYAQKTFINAALILVGTKLDVLHVKTKTKFLQKLIRENRQQALKISQKWNIPYIETSALEYINVVSLFEQCVYEYWMQTQSNSVK